MGELEYDITRCDECIYHPNSEARCFGKVNPGPPEPPRPSTISGEEIDESIQRALDNQGELSEQLDQSFGPVADVTLRATGAGRGSDDCPCEDCYSWDGLYHSAEGCRKHVVSGGHACDEYTRW
ncbi:MAG: hypothetical protein ACYTBJ_17260, partial [Planctomycetota bacterium]